MAAQADNNGAKNVASLQDVNSESVDLVSNVLFSLYSSCCCQSTSVASSSREEIHERNIKELR